MHKLVVSMALGAFVAGMLLADSEYRHEIEADIEPFKGLLLGLFFMAVGMSLNFDLIAAEPVVIGALDRKSTRLNSSHSQISYAVFCLKKKKKKNKKRDTHKTNVRN